MYNRIAHFQHILNHIQGKCLPDIPEEIYDTILDKIKEQNITDLKISHIKDILKSIKAQLYYDQIILIFNRLKTDKPIPQFSDELEEKLRNMFMQVQESFERYKKTQQNFISFFSIHYCLHKLIQILKHDEYLYMIPLIRSKEKLALYDMKWKFICEDLGWAFISSI